MGDRGRGRGPQQFGSRPLGRMPEFGSGGRGLGRGPSPGNRPLGSAPIRTSSGGLAAIGSSALGAALAGSNSAAAAGGGSAAAGGRGAGPDHREVRYADGVLAMINVLRLLTLGGPRTWDAHTHKQVGMVAALRPSPGAAGREVNLMVNHFGLVIKPGSSMHVYALAVTQLSTQQQQQPGSSADHQNAVSSGGAAADIPSASPQQRLPRGLLQRVLVQTGCEAGWPASWVLVGSSRLAACDNLLGSSSAAGAVHEAVVTLQQQQSGGEAGSAAEQAGAGPSSSSNSAGGGGGTFKVVLTFLGLHDLHELRSTAAVEAAGGSTPLLDGIRLLEAMLLAAALAPPPAAVAASSRASPVAPPAAASGAVSVPGAPASGTGLMGLAGVAVPGQLGVPGASVGSPSAAAGPLATSLSPAAAGNTAAAAAAAAAGTAGSSSILGAGGSNGVVTAASLAAVPRLHIGDGVYFNAPGNPDMHALLGGGVEAWLGFKQCVSMSQSGPELVMDLTAAPFFEPGPLLRLLPGLLGRPTAALITPDEAAAGGSSSSSSPPSAPGSSLASLSPAEQRRLEQLLVGVKVEVALPGRPASLGPIRVKGLSGSSAADTTFTLNSSSAAGDAGSVVSVSAYFKAVHGLELSAPQLPCLDVGRGARRVWYPLELCSLPPGQVYPSPLDHAQLSGMSRLAAKKSSDRKVWLEALAAPLAAAAAAAAAEPAAAPGAEPAAAASGGGGGGGALSVSGVEVSGLLGIVRGRVLPPPHLAYHTPECCYPGSQGQWNVKSCRLPGCSRIGSWCLVVLLPQAQVDLDGPSGVVPFMQDLTASLASTGVDASMPPIVYEQPGLSVLQHLRAACEAAQKHFNASAELLLVMLPSRSPSLYQEVKMASDAALGLPSQVLVAPVAGVGKGAAPRGRLQYCANLGLKINAKMGGVNMRLAGNPDQVIPVVGGRPFILFGVALATPPASAPPGSPAAAAVVASRDRSLGRYSSRVLLQPWQQPDASSGPLPGQLVVAGLKGAAKELLIDFYRQNGGRKPEALLCYRAASGEGHGQALVAQEYEALRTACFELEESYCPPITFVTVTRNHNTRLFPADRDNQDKSGNCLPGTVVDTGICHPTQFDFFLNSHAGLQGQNKPAHYHVLVDENAFSADGLQVLTYWLCYLYCRCTRSVSIVPPAYYAQLAAARGRLIATGRDLLGTKTSSLGAEEAAPEIPGLDFNVRVNAKLGGSMYYV